MNATYSPAWPRDEQGRLRPLDGFTAGQKPHRYCLTCHRSRQRVYRTAHRDEINAACRIYARARYLRKKADAHLESQP